MLYLGWVVAAFLGGGITAHLCLQRRRTLRDRFEALGSARGKTYEAIAAAVGAAPQCIQHQQQGQTLRTWQEGHYSISLLFDCCDCCMGVMDERY